MILFNLSNKAIYFLLFLFSITLLWGEKIPFQSSTNYEDFAVLEEPLTPDQFSLLLLVASGLPEDQIKGYLSRINTILKESDSWVSPDKTVKENAESLLRQMHEQILNRYFFSQTKVDTLLDNGNYNCVSSAVFYMLLARYHHIIIKGIHTVDHAFCLLPGQNGQPDIDIETTNEWGFDPGSRKEFQSSFTDRTGFVYVPPGHYRTRILIGDKEMAGLILQNRIVELQKRNLHQDALTLAADRLVLTGSQQARSDYFSAVQNAASLFNTQKKYVKAVEIINKVETGLSGIPDTLKETRSKILFNACADLVNQNKLDEAQTFVSNWKNFLSKNDEVNINKIIIQRDLELKVSKGFSLPLIDTIKSAADAGQISAAKASSMAAFNYSLKAQQLSKTGKHKDALLLLESVPSWVKNDREYKRLLSILKQNAAIDFHNRIVKLLRSDQKNEAKVLLSEALNLIPGNTILLQDKRQITQ